MMLFWSLLAALTAAAVFAVLWPLSRVPRAEFAEPAGVAVYRDQLAEIERDREQGLLPSAETEAARIEISRRLLSAAEDKSPAATASLSRRRFASLAALAGIPAISLTLYLALGVPEQADAPLAARLALPVEQQDIGILIGRLEQRLATKPEDGMGWELLAPIYLRVGRAEDAFAAQQNAIRILGSNAARQVTLGEALLTQSPGKIPAEAQAAFERALEHEPNFAPALFYLGLAAEQNGDAATARKFWMKIVEVAPPRDPWRIPAERRLQLLQKSGR